MRLWEEQNTGAGMVSVLNDLWGLLPSCREGVQETHRAD
jgi:hypothetical protein